MIVLESLFPVFVLISLGVWLKRIGVTDSVFLSRADKLVYYIFFPVMLFWKIGGVSIQGGMLNWTFHLVTLLLVIFMALVSFVVIRLAGIGDFQAGTFSQSCYRFNTYIGVAVLLNSLGAEGVAVFGVLIGLVIPTINVMAVSTMIWYSGQRLDNLQRLRLLVRALAGNPLILGCLAGLIHSRLVGSFPVFIDNTFSLMTMVVMPLALLSIGGALTFASLRKNWRVALMAATVKLTVLPALGYGCYRLLQIDGVEFSTGMIFLALPAATSIYVLSSQMGGDTELASSTIVLSTLLSFFSLSIALLL